MPLVEANIVPESLSLDTLVPIFKRGWLFALLLFIAMVLGIYGGLMYATEQYEANARLLVKLGRENAQAPLTVDNGAVLTTGVQKEEINSYIQILTSRPLLEETVARLGANSFDFKPAPPETLLQHVKYALKAALRWVKQRIFDFLILLDLKAQLSLDEKAVKLLEKSLVVERERDSNVIGVNLRLPHPGLARDTVAALIDLYLEQHVNLRRDVDIGKVFETQTDVYKVELDALRDRIQQVKNEWNLSAVDQQRAGMITRLETLTQALHTKENNLARTDREATIIQQQIDALPRTRISSSVVEPNPAVQKIKDRLVELRLKQVNMANLYQEGSDALALLNKEIAELSALLDAEQETKQGEVTYSPYAQRDVLEQSRAELARGEAGLRAEIELDRKAIAEVNRQLRGLNEGEALLRMLELDWDVLEKKYKANATRREEARISEALSLRRVANVAVLSAPSVAPEPVSPRKLLIMAVGSVMALFVSIGIALLREWSRDVVYSREDLARIPDFYVLGELRTG